MGDDGQQVVGVEGQNIPLLPGLGQYAALIRYASEHWHKLQYDFCSGRRNACEQEMIIGMLLDRMTGADSFWVSSELPPDSGGGLFRFSAARDSLADNRDIVLSDDRRLMAPTTALLFRIGSRCAAAMGASVPTTDGSLIPDTREDGSSPARALR